ncbi:MAG: antitoxin Xre/MbcA/ParS toxin-binding domain-containing protein [Bacteroidota bacterium]
MENILNDPAAKYHKATEGISKSDFLVIVANTGLNLTEFSALLPVSRRTIEKAKDKDLLSPAVSDRVLQVASLYEHGGLILGDNATFKEWLDSPLISLGGKKPIEFINNDTGISMINDLLGRIEHGVYS